MFLLRLQVPLHADLMVKAPSAVRGPRTDGPNAPLKVIQHRRWSQADELAFLVQVQGERIELKVRWGAEHDHSELLRIVLVLLGRLTDRSSDRLDDRRVHHRPEFSPHRVGARRHQLGHEDDADVLDRVDPERGRRHAAP